MSAVLNFDSMFVIALAGALKNAAQGHFVLLTAAWSGFKVFNFVGQIPGLQVRPITFQGYDLRAQS
eukprot:6213451-Pleurochrysis_carterae.AAC.5